MARGDSGRLPSPLRGTPGWWQELGREAETSWAADSSWAGETAEPAPLPKKGRRRGATSIRAELVARVRQQIADGTYDTDEKWHAALDRLLERL